MLTTILTCVLMLDTLDTYHTEDITLNVPHLYYNKAHSFQGFLTFTIVIYNRNTVGIYICHCASQSGQSVGSILLLMFCLLFLSLLFYVWPIIPSYCMFLLFSPSRFWTDLWSESNPNWLESIYPAILWSEWNLWSPGRPTVLILHRE